MSTTIPFGIMNTTNNHDEILVNTINKAWSIPRFNYRMRWCMRSMIERDREEIDELFHIGDAPFNDFHGYLMNIADDDDLFLILNFLGYYTNPKVANMIDSVELSKITIVVKCNDGIEYAMSYEDYTSPSAYNKEHDKRYYDFKAKFDRNAITSITYYIQPLNNH